MGMGMMVVGNADSTKARIAIEICDLTACANLHQTPFINWYLVLNVDENADAEWIRKQYHKLALQVHPDKNKHSKAETAFKLVSEAYLSLSDKAKRAAFDSLRKTISCNKCNKFPLNTSIPAHEAIKEPYQETTSIDRDRIRRRMKELRTKLKEEAITIEKCLTANAAMSRREYYTNARTETPVFNPSDYKHRGYPHYRKVDCKRMQDFLAGFRMGNRCLHDTAKNGYPVFQYRPEGSSFYV